MTGALASQSLFTTLINHMANGRLLGGIQFHTLTHFSDILAGVPEGHMAAAAIRTELEKTPNRIDTVPPEIIGTLRNALPLLERAVSSPSESKPAEALQKLQRILQLTGSSTGVSQTMAAVLDPGTAERARDVIRSPERPRITSPALRYLEGMRSVGTSSRMPVFMLEGKVVHINDWPALLKLLSDRFGYPVTQDALRDLFSLDQEEWRIRAVDIRPEPNQLRIAGEIRRGNQTGGYFGMLIPSVPERGSPWTVKVEAINVMQERRGIGSSLLFRVALFLHEIGVHTMEASAIESAGLFCVFNGFRAGKSLYEEVVAEFVEDMKKQSIAVPESLVRTRLLDRDANLAELATFEVDGKRLGREFLRKRFTEKYMLVKFELSADKQAWLRLLSNLHRNDSDLRIVPSEWERLRPSTRQMLLSGAAFVGGNVLHLMSSDRDHAIHLIERLNNWATGISMAMSLPPEYFDRLTGEMKDISMAQMNAVDDVLRMIEGDPTSVLLSNFLDHMSTGSDEALDISTNRSFLIARTLLKASQRGFLRIPPVILKFFTELVERDG